MDAGLKAAFLMKALNVTSRERAKLKSSLSFSYYVIYPLVYLFAYFGGWELLNKGSYTFIKVYDSVTESFKGVLMKIVTKTNLKFYKIPLHSM